MRTLKFPGDVARLRCGYRLRPHADASSSLRGKISTVVCVAGLVVFSGCGSLSESADLCVDENTFACLRERQTDETNSWRVPSNTDVMTHDVSVASREPEEDLSETGNAREPSGSNEDDSIAPADTTIDPASSLLPCERRGVFTVSQAGRVNGVVRVTFSRPENLRSDWRNLSFLVDHTLPPFAVESDDGETVQLLVYLSALSAVETPWYANACRDDPEHGPSPDEVWRYQLEPVLPSSENANSTATSGFAMDCTAQDGEESVPRWGCGHFMYRDGAAEDAWGIALRSRSGCGDYPIPGNYGHLEQSLNIPNGKYRLQGILGAKAQRYQQCDSPLSAHAFLAVGELAALDSSDSAPISEIEFAESYECVEQITDAVPIDVEVNVSTSARIRLAVATGDCADATTSLSDLRLYRLPDLEVASVESGAEAAE